MTAELPDDAITASGADLFPLDRLALHMAKEQIMRGENPPMNTTATLVAALERITAALPALTAAITAQAEDCEWEPHQGGCCCFREPGQEHASWCELVDTGPVPGRDGGNGAQPGAATEREQEVIRRHAAEQDAVHADLGQLLEILGLRDYARPQSPHEVFQMCLTRLRERLAFAERTGEQITAQATTADDEEGGYEPFIAAEGWREETSIRYVPESRVAEAAAQAAAAEREACIALAIERKAVYVVWHKDIKRYRQYPFADLLGGTADGADTPGQHS